MAGTLGWAQYGRAAAGLLVGVLIAAGCGGPADSAGIATLQGAPSTSVASAAEGQADLEAALLAFAACMREEGVDLPDPQVDAGGNVRLVDMIVGGGRALAGEDRDRVRAAADACREHLEGVALRFAAVDRTELQDRLLSYAGCMREHGFDLPDPDLSGGTGGPGMAGVFPGVGIEAFDDPAFEEAHESCRDIFAGALPGEAGPGPAPGR